MQERDRDIYGISIDKIIALSTNNTTPVNGNKGTIYLLDRVFDFFYWQNNEVDECEICLIFFILFHFFDSKDCKA